MNERFIVMRNGEVIGSYSSYIRAIFEAQNGEKVFDSLAGMFV